MKRYLLITLLALLLLSLAASVQAETEPLVRYPGVPFARAASTIVPYLELPGAQDPTKGIPQYIRYVFVFSLGIVGIVAFIAMLIAAFGYVTSVGNPQKASAAKDRIFSALLGMLLLFGSYLLLNTINPDLLRLKITGEKVNIPVGPEKEAECRYANMYWTKDKDPIEGDTIDAGAYGDSIVTLNFTLSKECDMDKVVIDNETMGWKLMQDCKRFGIGTCLGIDEDCDEEICDKQLTMGPKKEKRLYTICDFNDLCRTDCSEPACNFIKDKQERFYIDGWIRVSKNADKQWLSGLNLWVRDLDSNGACCR